MSTSGPCRGGAGSGGADWENGGSWWRPQGRVGAGVPTRPLSSIPGVDRRTLETAAALMNGGRAPTTVTSFTKSLLPRQSEEKR
jgi:hypothetical protein